MDIERIGSETALDLEIVRRLSSKKYNSPRWVYNNVEAGTQAYKAGAEKALNAYCKAMMTSSSSSSSSRVGGKRYAVRDGKLKKKKVNVKEFLEKRFLHKCRTDKVCLFGKEENNKTKFELMVLLSKKGYERMKQKAVHNDDEMQQGK